jgi:hypothetical protein
VPLGITATVASKTITVTVVGGTGYTIGDPATASETIFLVEGLCAVPAPPPAPPVVNPTFTG